MSNFERADLIDLCATLRRDALRWAAHSLGDWPRLSQVVSPTPTTATQSRIVRAAMVTPTQSSTGCSETHGKTLEAVVQIGAYANGVAGLLDHRKRVQQSFEEDSAFESGQMGSEAEMLTNPE